MRAYVIADLMELAVHDSLGGMCAHHSQGDVDIQDVLFRQASGLLKKFGVAKPRKATGKELIDCAAWIRRNHPQDRYTSKVRLAQILTRSAGWIEGIGNQYGPLRHRPGNDIIDAVAAACVTLDERYDTLTVIVQSVPAQTITQWEWRINKDGAEGAVALLKKLADDVPDQRRVGRMHAEAPPPVYLKISLDTPSINDLAREAIGKPEPQRTPGEKRELIRSYQEDAAAAEDDKLADYLQGRADRLRRG